MNEYAVKKCDDFLHTICVEFRPIKHEPAANTGVFIRFFMCREVLFRIVAYFHGFMPIYSVSRARDSRLVCLSCMWETDLYIYEFKKKKYIFG